MFEGCEYYLRHYDAPLQAIPILHIMSFDDEHFYIGGFYASDSSTTEKAVYIRDLSMTKMLQDYWDELWKRSKPLNEGKIIDWNELKLIASRIGISEDEFDTSVRQLRADAEKRKKQLQRKK